MQQPDNGNDARRLYEDVVRRAMRHALRHTGRGDALEVAHDVACELVRRRLAGLDDPDDPRSFEGLIARAVANRLNNLRRSADRRATAERVHLEERALGAQAWGAADAALAHDELSRVVEATIAAMPEKMRTAFLLVRRDGLSYREAAERMGVEVGTIHTHLARASSRLRDAVARYEHGVAAPSRASTATRP